MTSELGSLLAALKARIECSPGCDSYSLGGAPCDCDREARLDAAIVRGVEAAIEAAGAETFNLYASKDTREQVAVWANRAALAALSKEWA